MRMGKVRLTARTKRLLLASALEVYPNETNGFLLCRPRSERIVVDGIYTIQTAIRKRGEVEHGNVSAVGRVLSTISVMEGNGFVGGYHSHPDHVPRLTKTDLNYIEGEMERLRKHGIKLKKWLEIVIGVRKKQYKHPTKAGWRYRTEEKSGITLKLSKTNGSARHRYNIAMAAYWVYMHSGKFRKKQVELLLP
jgi:proteasome lid subunit RPN8/RPN11